MNGQPRASAPVFIRTPARPENRAAQGDIATAPSRIEVEAQSHPHRPGAVEARADGAGRWARRCFARGTAEKSCGLRPNIRDLRTLQHSERTLIPIKAYPPDLRRNVAHAKLTVRTNLAMAPR